MITDSQQIELAKQGIQSAVEGVFAPFKEIITRALGPFADHIGGIGGLYGRQWRLERELAFWEKYNATIRGLGRQPNPVPPKTFFPILHQAFLEDDDDLQARWAALLATATTDPDAYRPIFADILRTLTAVEVKVLAALYTEFFAYYHDRYDNVMPQHAAIEHVQVGDEEAVADHLIKLGHLQVQKWEDLYTTNPDVDQNIFFSDKAKVKFVLDSLMRNQLLYRRQTPNGHPALWLTTLGLRFLEACGTHERRTQREGVGQVDQD